MSTIIATMKTTFTYKENNYKFINVKDEICIFYVGGLRLPYSIFSFDLLIKSELPFRVLCTLGIIPNFISQISASDLIVDLCLFSTNQLLVQNSLFKAHLFN